MRRVTSIDTGNTSICINDVLLVNIYVNTYIESSLYIVCGQSVCMHVCAYNLLVHCLYRTYTKYTFSTDECIRSCLYTVTVSMHVNNHIILKFRISMAKSALESEILQKSSLKSGNWAEIIIAWFRSLEIGQKSSLHDSEVWKSCENLHWNLEILHEILEILKSCMKSWNLSGNLAIFSKIPRFRNLVRWWGLSATKGVGSYSWKYLDSDILIIWYTWYVSF